MNASFPKISIVTACYNHASFIAETIESIVSQEYPNLEYIVMDDGSTDGSWEVIQRYRSRLTHCERLEGYRASPVAALNEGFQKTTGEIMLFLNSDDILLPKSLFVIAKIYQEHPEVEWLTGMATTINERSELVNSRLRLKHLFDFLIGNWKIIQQESTSWRRSLWEKTGGALNGEKRWAFDTELWTRFFLHATHFHAATPLGAFRSGKQSQSVSSQESFLAPSRFYLHRLTTAASQKQRLLAYLYRLCRPLGSILALIPNARYQRIPFLNHFAYDVLTYDQGQDRWKAQKQNPFRPAL
ncbi:glycosyltransferase [Candidatus Uhrbacteria bacterium]|nr:glycosyltransferase [Candidatus Uhrbacteria bacterium]